jgi:O-antigen/teichoic acid export membrane protein
MGESNVANCPREENLPGRFLVNVLSNLALFGLNVVVGLWLTPYLVTYLGMAVYGLVPLATSITSYMSILSSALNSAVGRFLTIDLRRDLLYSAKRTFSTAFFGSLGLGLVALPLILGFSAAIPFLFDVPLGQESAARLLFAAIMIAFLLGIVRSVFALSAFASNRLDLQNAISASDLLIRLSAIVLFSKIFVLRVGHVGLATILGGGLSLFLAVLIYRRLVPELTVDFQAFDLPRLRELFGMSGWITVNQMGTLLFLNIDLIVVNLFLGAEAGGRYGSVLQWSILLRALARTVAGGLAPIIFAKHVEGEEQITIVVRQATRLLGLGMALPIGIVSGLSGPLLRVWLGSEFAELATLMSMLTFHLCINLAVTPLFTVQVSANRVKWPAVVTFLMGVANLGLALWWVGWRRDGLGVALAGALVLTLKNAIFTPIYTARILRVRWDTFLQSIMPGVIGTAGVGLMSYLVSVILELDSWFDIGGVVLGILVLYVALAYSLALSNKERRLLLDFLPLRKV